MGCSLAVLTHTQICAVLQLDQGFACGLLASGSFLDFSGYVFTFGGSWCLMSYCKRIPRVSKTQHGLLRIHPNSICIDRAGESGLGRKQEDREAIHAELEDTGR